VVVILARRDPNIVDESKMISDNVQADPLKEEVQVAVEDERSMDVDESKMISDNVQAEPLKEEAQVAVEDERSMDVLAKKTFDKADYTLWSVAASVAIRNLTLNKHGKTHSDNEGEFTMARAPTVASAILGEWLANKMGLSGKKSQSSSSNEASSFSNQKVFSNVNV
jgi:hypothetical protein